MGLLYGGIDLGTHLLTQSIEQAPAFDPSNSDQLFTDITLRVKSVVYPSCLAALPGETPPDTVGRIRHYLTAPRRPLVYSAGGVNFINLPGGLDDANGPLPLPGLSVLQLSPGSWIVSWGVRVRLTDCGTTPPAYLSNRWEEAVSTDKDGYDTKRRAGLLVVSSRGPSSPDDLRSLVTPGIDPGFRRESADYRLAPDGLHYHYAFVDRKLSKVPPAPATSMEGEQAEIVAKSGGQRHGRLHLTLTGPPTVDPRDLMTAAIRTGMGRVYASNPLFAFKRIMTEGSVRESLSESKNVVSLQLQWIIDPKQARTSGGLLTTDPTAGGQGGRLNADTPEGKRQAALGMYAVWLGRPLDGTDPARGIAPPTRGVTGQIKLIAAALRDPCGSEVELSTTGTDNDLVGTTAGGSAVTVGTYDPNAPPDDNATLYAADDSPGVWDTWVMTAHYTDDTGRDVLPPAKPDGDGKLVVMRGRALAVRYEWAFTRLGGQPTVPIPDADADDNWVYICGDFSAEAMDVAADSASIRYTAAGWFLYKAISPQKVVLMYPVPPFLDRSQLTTQAKVSELRGDPRIRGIGLPPPGTTTNDLRGGPTTGGGLPGN